MIFDPFSNYKIGETQNYLLINLGLKAKIIFFSCVECKALAIEN